MSRGRRRTERAAASLFAVSCLALLLMVGSALGVVAALFVAHRSAQAAADLAALAAASAAGRGDDACAAGAALAAANGARLVSCTPEGREVRLEVEVTGPRWLGQTADLRAQARAGPAGAVDRPTPG